MKTHTKEFHWHPAQSKGFQGAAPNKAIDESMLLSACTGTPTAKAGTP